RDWSSDVCSSDLCPRLGTALGRSEHGTGRARRGRDGERTFPCSIAGTFLDAGTEKSDTSTREEGKRPRTAEERTAPSCATTPGSPEHGGNAGPKLLSLGVMSIWI